MKVLLILLGIIVLGILFLFGLVIYESYRYPVCPKCESNEYSVRVKGKNICSVHGKF